MKAPFLFPTWSNLVLPLLVVAALLTPLYAIYVVAYGFSPATTDVGYEPVQPVEYSHELHVGKLGIDCRYCHNTVERAAFAAIPPTQTCMNCHTQIHKDSPKLTVVRDSYVTGMPVPWVKVHDLPDYSYFNHSAHVNRGVSCVSCHGRVDRMPVVYQHEKLSMGWCLSCHREPEPNVRDPREVTNLGWGVDMTPREKQAMSAAYGIAFEPEQTMLTAAQRTEIGRFWIKRNQLQTLEDCSTCHR
jgi:menaquinone reductase, multiheme cytochrome c subunit